MYIFTMAINNFILIYILSLVIQMAKGAVPGTFFWRPRMGIDLSIPTTESSVGEVNLPTGENLKLGLVVLVDGYQMGLTVMGLATGFSAAKPYPHLNPMTAYYWTNVYRWALRYVSLIPPWAGGNGGHLAETHRAWKRRYYYMDEQVPYWLRWLVPHVKQQSWDDLELDQKRFKAYAEAAFGKHYRYPTKPFRNFVSFITAETQELLESDSLPDLPVPPKKG